MVRFTHPAALSPVPPPLGDFFRQPLIILGPVRIGGVLEDRLAEAGGLGQADVAANPRLEGLRVGPGVGWPRALRKNSSTSWPTSAASRVPPSYMQRITPLSLSLSLMRAATRSMVSSSLLSPCRAKKCGCKGISTSLTAASALSVRMPSDGGQSIKQVIDRRRVVAELVAEDHFAADHADQFQLRRRQVQARRHEPQILRHLPAHFADARLPGQNVVDREFVGPRLDAEVQRGVGLGIEVEQARLSPVAASAAHRFTAVVVFPTPPFWFMMAMERMERNSDQEIYLDNEMESLCVFYF